MQPAPEFPPGSNSPTSFPWLWFTPIAELSSPRAPMALDCSGIASIGIPLRGINPRTPRVLSKRTYDQGVPIDRHRRTKSIKPPSI